MSPLRLQSSSVAAGSAGAVADGTVAVAIAGAPGTTGASASGDTDRRQALAAAIEGWRTRLGAAGVACRAVAVCGDAAVDAGWRIDFPPLLGDLQASFAMLSPRVLAGEPVAVAKTPGAPGADLLLATALQMPGGALAVLGVALAPPHNDRTVQIVLLSVGWLQLHVDAALAQQHGQRAARLLELLGYVAAQSGARAAAQEWVNRTAAWARETCSDADDSADPTLALTLFSVRNGLPHWWVSADTAWAEATSPALQQAREVATRAAVELQEVHDRHHWAVPALGDGDATSILVVSTGDGVPAATLPDAAVLAIRASLGLAEPLLRRWQQADRSLLRHHTDALAAAWRKLRGPGHLAWKAGAAATAAALALLLLFPVPDRATANTVIEGRVRQLVTAPFDGFISQVLVRPGEHIARGQVLARLDDRDLKLEQSKTRSERDQATARLRQAMADRDAPAMALAQAEVQQAEAQLALVEAKLGRAELVSPLDGLLVSGDWVQQVGGPVEVGRELFEIAAGDGWRVVLHVPDRDIARVRVGQPGLLRLTGQPQAAHAFRVSNVTATAAVQDGVNGFRVEAEWLGDVPPLSPGMQGIGKIEVGRSNLLTVWTRSSVDWARLKLWSWWW